MAVGFGGAIFEGGGEVWVEVGCAVEEAFGALGDEFGRGGGGVGEDWGWWDGMC